MQAAFLETWGIAAADKADYPFLADGRLWRNDKAQDVATGSLDWFGRGVVRPDVVLAEVAAVMTGGPAAAASELYFFRNVARGDAVVGLAGTCPATFGCDGYAQQTPLVPETFASASEASPDGGVAGEQSSDESGAGVAVPAGAASAALLAACGLLAML